MSLDVMNLKEVAVTRKEDGDLKYHRPKFEFWLALLSYVV